VLPPPRPCASPQAGSQEGQKGPSPEASDVRWTFFSVGSEIPRLGKVGRENHRKSPAGWPGPLVEAQGSRSPGPEGQRGELLRAAPVLPLGPAASDRRDAYGAIPQGCAGPPRAGRAGKPASDDPRRVSGGGARQARGSAK